jgi:hypothetical protein
MTESGGKAACSVSSSGIRQVKQCLEAVLVAFEVAGNKTRVVEFYPLNLVLQFVGCARSLQQVFVFTVLRALCVSCAHTDVRSGQNHTQTPRTIIPCSVRFSRRAFIVFISCANFVTRTRSHGARTAASCYAAAAPFCAGVAPVPPHAACSFVPYLNSLSGYSCCWPVLLSLTLNLEVTAN